MRRLKSRDLVTNNPEIKGCRRKPVFMTSTGTGGKLHVEAGIKSNLKPSTSFFKTGEKMFGLAGVVASASSPQPLME